MLSIKIENVVSSMVRQLLINDDSDVIKGKALHFHFDCRLGYEDFNVSRGLHLLYGRRPQGSYVDVFSAILDSPFDKISKVVNWKHECSHDSCWRDIGVFSQVYFDMADSINAKRVKEGLNAVAPIEMHEYNSFNEIDRFFQWVSVEITKDPSDERNYRKLIKVL
jgi:hypothetical protein